jgi:hypothetical protein
MLADFFT